MKKPRFAPRPALLKQIIDRSNYSIHPRSKTRMVSNRFWHIVSVVKERTPLSSRKALPKPNEYAKAIASCQHRLTLFSRVFHRGSRDEYAANLPTIIGISLQS